MKTNTLIQIIICIAVVIVVHNNAVSMERASRKAHIKARAEAETLVYQQKRLTRSRLPLIEYAFAEAVDWLNN